MRTSVFKQIDDPVAFSRQLLAWGQSFREILFLDSSQCVQTYTSFDCAMAVDALTAIQTDYQGAFEDLKQYQETTCDWIFGYLAYDLKNDTEALHSANFDGLGFPELFFFQPKKLFFLRGNQLEICYLPLCDEELESDFTEISQMATVTTAAMADCDIRPRLSRQEYLEKVQQLLQHIHLGDIYEANFCQEFYAQPAFLEPLGIYDKLQAISSPPFAAYFKNGAHYALCASPERYLRKEGIKVISQPIKGTAARFADPLADEKSRQELCEDPKERSENIMIVDLVRNDLSRTAAKGSVAVEELCGAYTFKQVHQLISTIVSQIAEQTNPVEVIRTTFPMGSMTGAPKISAMQLIESLEASKRGLYSGAMGYFTPDGDFDFNVVIRSILYNSRNNYLSFSVGSAITALSDPKKEYEECLIKAKAMFEVLQPK